MAGGVKKPVNIFKLKDLGEPEGTLNWRLWFAVFAFGMLGAARGVDEGLISGVIGAATFREAIGWASYSVVQQANIKANISAMVQIGSVAGALFAFLICDRIGRIWATRQLCIVWAVGIAIFMVGGVKGNLGVIYAGRFIAGLGVGQTPVVGPIYVAEIAPASIRGLCTCFFTGAVYFGISLSYFANYGCNLHISSSSYNQWLIPTSLHIMFSGLIFVVSWFQMESPRFLVKQGKSAEATRVLARLRQQDPEGDYITGEIAAIQAALEHELEASRGVGWLGKLKEMFLDKSNLYRVYLSTMTQILSQWSGTGSITLYAPQFFGLLGITGTSSTLLVTAVFGLVKFIAAMVCALFLVDVVGRKRSLLIGITLQSVAMIYVAGFLTAAPQLGVVSGYVLPKSLEGPSIGAVFMIYVSGVGWALGWNSMQYLLTAELYPLRIRALATSLAMTLHFANQYGNARAVPNMLLSAADGGISPVGTFWCFAVVTIVGGIWVWFFVPETGGRTLESMDRLFDLPWYRIGLHGNEDAEQQDRAMDEKARVAEEERGQAQHCEEKV